MQPAAIPAIPYRARPSKKIFLLQKRSATRPAINSEDTMKIKSAVTIQDKVVLDVVALNLSSMNGKPTNMAELSINNRNIEAEQTNKTTQARLGIASNGSVPASEFSSDFVTLQVGGNALQEPPPPRPDTILAVAEQVHSLKES